jgi:hypothetical protein
VQRTQPAILAPHGEQRQAGNLADDVITGRLKLRLVSEELPAARENGSPVQLSAVRAAVKARGQCSRHVQRLCLQFLGRHVEYLASGYRASICATGGHVKTDGAGRSALAR